VGGQLTLHRNLADARIKVLSADAATGEQGHYTETGCAKSNMHGNVLIFRK
jgi:hypothetical protein